MSLRPYLYLSGVSGSVTADPLTVPINSSFGDLLDNVRISVFAAVTAEKGPWGVYGDFQYISLVGEGTGQTGSSLELDNIITEGDLTLRPKGAATLRFLAGVRVYAVDETLTLLGQAPITASTTVVDPVVGATGAWALGQRWNFEIRGDIGGFGVGSEFTHQLAVDFLWHISDTVRLPFGYRVLGYQIKSGDVWLNTRMGGLVVGLDFQL